MCGRLDDVMKTSIDKQCVPGAGAGVFIGINANQNGFIGCYPIKENGKEVLLEGFGWWGSEPPLRLEIISVRKSNRVLRGVDGNQPTVMSLSSRNADRCPAAQTRGVAGGKAVKTWKGLRHQGNSCTPIL